MTAELLGLARTGDGRAFAQLTDPYRHELQVHCYRILGSAQDAEDVLQEVLLAAWQNLDGFEGRSWLRPAGLTRATQARCQWNTTGREPRH